ncbi:hypothetical protein EMIT0P2_340001 [Pseudomonas sp. IT-P2]
MLKHHQHSCSIREYVGNTSSKEWDLFTILNDYKSHHIYHWTNLYILKVFHFNFKISLASLPVVELFKNCSISMDYLIPNTENKIIHFNNLKLSTSTSYNSGFVRGVLSMKLT